MSITLPNEIWALVLAPLPLRALLSTPLASRAWQSTTFPYLYRMVFFTRPQHFGRFARRITLARGAGLATHTHVRALFLEREKGWWAAHPDGENLIRKDDLGYLITILSVVAVHLEKFTWDLPFLPHRPEEAQLLQTGCSNLRSLHFNVSEETEGFHGGGSRTA
jgi:hypothetical protein